MQSISVLKKALDKIPIGITVTDPKRHIIYTNRTDAIMHGYSVEELMGKDVRIFAPPELWNPAPMDKMVTKQIWQRESLNKRKDGKLFPVFLLSDIVTDKRGHPAMIVTACENITEKKRAEKLLQESETKYRTLFEASPDAIFIGKVNGKTLKFVDFNATTLRIFNCKRRELLGKTPLDVSPPVQEDGSPSAEKALQYIVPALEGKPQFFEWQHCSLDGTPFDAEVILHCVELTDGLYMQGIVRNISTRKKAEKALAQTRNELKKKVESLEDFYHVAVGREIKIEQMQQEINELKKELEQCKKS
jgi:PAS domain S-box-containing protein